MFCSFGETRRNSMKTLEEIQEEVKSNLKNCNWPDKDVNQLYESVCVMTLVEEVAYRYAKEVAKEALNNASEKSQLMMYYIDEEDTTNVDILNFKHRRIQSCYAVPKQSILNESNIPKL